MALVGFLYKSVSLDEMKFVLKKNKISQTHVKNQAELTALLTGVDVGDET